MRKLLPILVVAAGLFLALPALAQEVINSFHVRININQNASLNVTETIVYDFGAEQRHGIFREIPYKYRTDADRRTIELSNIRVTNGQGHRLTTSISNSGDNKVIRIGDADIFVSGVQTYIINYKIEGAINYFDDHDELYWNVTGDDWQVGISNTVAEVILPGTVSGEDIDFTCFAGVFGSNLSCDTSSHSGNTSTFSQNELLPGQGLTVVFGFPKNTVHEPSAWDKFVKTLKDNIILFLPLLVLIIMWRLWLTKGRDPAGRGTIVAQYEPPDNLTPAEVGTIVDEKVHPKDTSSMIIDLAVRGYLKIRRIEKSGIFGSTDYELTKLKAGDDLKNNFEKEFFEKLFTTKKHKSGLSKVVEVISGKAEAVPDDVVKISELKNSFYKTLQEVNKQIYKSTVTKGYFEKNPNTVRTVFAVIGIIVMFLSFPLAGIFGFLAVIALVLSGLIILLFGLKMPKKTVRGAEVYEQILGLKEYLSVAEKDRIEFHNAPEKSPERFEKLLPYAMVLGVEKAWATQFKDIYTQQPSWYQGGQGDVFSAIILTSALSDFNSQTQSVLASSPSSAAGGGSGFSGGGVGGGFGGGGGGSW